jgi:hypothetical protein
MLLTGKLGGAKEGILRALVTEANARRAAE